MGKFLDKLRPLSRRGFIAGAAAAPLAVGGPAAAAPSSQAASAPDLFLNASRLPLPPSQSEFASSGYSREGLGAARYIHDPALDAAFVTANPRTSFQASDGRIFRIEQERVTPFMLGAIGDGVTDDSDALQAFADFTTTSPIRMADASGRFGVSRTLVWGREKGEPATRLYRGVMALRALGPIDEVLVFRNMTGARWLGEVDVTGTGGLAYASRTCGVGVVFDNCGRMSFAGGVRARRFHFAGVSAHRGNNNLLDIGNSSFTDVGSGHRQGKRNFSLAGRWAAPSNSGGAGSAAQRTTIRVDTIFPEGIERYGRIGNAPIQVRINKYLYFVYSVDRVAGTATIYPWLDPTAGSEGSFEWVLGAGLYLYGGDTNVIRFERADCRRCGRGLAASSLYAPTADRLVTQVTGTALLFGRQPAGAVLGGHIRGVYFESNREDICVLSRQGDSFFNRIGSAYGLNFAKCHAIGDPRGKDGQIAGGEFKALPIPYRGRVIEYEKDNRLSAQSSVLAFEAAESRTHVYRRDGWTVNIAPLNRDLHRLKGYSGGRLLFESPEGANGTPAGTFIFNAPNGGTVNGGPSASFAGFAGPALFSIEIADPRNEAWTVRLIAGGGQKGGGVAVTQDTDLVLTASSKDTQIYEGELTMPRTVTLPASGREGRRFRFARSAQGTPSLEIIDTDGKRLKSLSAGQWCELEDDGSAFRIVGSGNL